MEELQAFTYRLLIELYYFSAPSSHTAAADRIQHTQPDTRPDYTGTEPAGNAALRPDHRIHTDVRRDSKTTGDITQHMPDQTSPTDYQAEAPQSIDTQEYNQQDYVTPKQEAKPQKRLSKQNSRESDGKEKVTHKQFVQNIEHTQPNVITNQEYDTNVNREEVIDQTQGETDVIEQEQEYATEGRPMEEQTQEYSAEYQNYDPNYVQNYEQPPQNYEQTQQNYEQTDPNYEQPQQNYEQTDPNFEQPEYTEQYENYEQYPQQFTDPNAQYEGQYENYPTDANYTQEAYDNTQYNPEYTEEQQYTQNVEQPTESNVEQTVASNVQNVDKVQKNNSTPKSKVASKS